MIAAWSVTLPAGTCFVETEQPLGAIAVYLCEARSDDGAKSDDKPARSRDIDGHGGPLEAGGAALTWEGGRWRPIERFRPPKPDPPKKIRRGEKPAPPPKRSSRTPPREREPAPAAADGSGVGKAVQSSRTSGGQQRVRRRKKKGPRSRR